MLLIWELRAKLVLIWMWCDPSMRLEAAGKQALQVLLPNQSVLSDTVT